MTACAIESGTTRESGSAPGDGSGAEGGSGAGSGSGAEGGSAAGGGSATVGGSGAGSGSATVGGSPSADRASGADSASTADGAITSGRPTPIPATTPTPIPAAAPSSCVITADGAYAARLAPHGDCWFPERWTLDGPEPYAVPLPGNQPEEPGTEVQPMRDGRVLIRRPTAGRHVFSLLYPTGPATGELLIGAVECPDGGARLRLLPPAPCGEKAYALAVGRRSSTVWLVAGGAFGPEHLAEIPGRCSGGVWLDRVGRLLALDREVGGRTKTVVVDLERGGEVTPLLQISAESDDRLLLADPDSGLLLIRSDAPSPGERRLGWGVLGSTLPVRFPESLRLPDCALTPFAIQPGQVLTPESCAVAVRVAGPMGDWVGVWRPDRRQIHHFPAPAGWLAGTGLWSRDGVLQLPYTTGEMPCGVARVTAPWTPAETSGATEATTATTTTATSATGATGATGATSITVATCTTGTTCITGTTRTTGVPSPAEASDTPAASDATGAPATPAPPIPTIPAAPAPPITPRPVPLREAPLGRLVTK
ncbi:hypothetical protein [Streptomyces griseoviridis]|nr:hypothetical protein [Streptomyces griseoviridis]